MPLLKQWLELSSQLLEETVQQNKYIPLTPTPKQALFLSLTGTEALFGGSAGPGKSTALLMAALQFVHLKGYSALILRKTYPELAQPGGLIPKSLEWLNGTDAKWNSTEHKWTFPSGSVLKFGYLANDADVYNYLSSEYQFLGFDEITEFNEWSYRYLFSRLRKPVTLQVPLRVRAATNPGGPGAAWVKRRFITERANNGIWFIPATLVDNPHLDQAEYTKSLSHLDPTTRAQLLRGDWNAVAGGNFFKRQWFSKIIKEAPAGIRKVRFWDCAATEKSQDNHDPDWTVGALVGFHDGIWYICDVKRLRGTPREVETLVKQTAVTDTYKVAVLMEQEPGASGKTMIDHYARKVLPGFNFAGIPSIKDKITRAGPFSSAAEAGNVVLVEGKWISDFLDELEIFPNGAHDDVVDGCSGAILNINAQAVLTKDSVYIPQWDEYQMST